jgi:hypothetical protein
MNWPIFRRLAPQAPPDDRSGGVGDHHSDHQPRVPPGDPSGDGGQWTKGGGTAVTKKGFLAPLPAAAAVAPTGGIAAELSAALSRLIAAGAARATLLGGLLIPTNRMHTASGVVPGSEHVRYDYDEGFLTLSRLGRTGETEILFHGHHEPDGSFINADGDALARDMGRGVFIDGNAVRALDLRTATRGHARQVNDNQRFVGGSPGPVNRPRFCPPITKDWPSNDDDDWQDYQQQVTGLPRGWAVELNGVRFDGCDETRRVMLEAKARYQQFLRKGQFGWQRWYQGGKAMIEKMRRQLVAADGRTIEWHFAQKECADYMRIQVERLAESEPAFEQIRVIHQERPARSK